VTDQVSTDRQDGIDPPMRLAAKRSGEIRRQAQAVLACRDPCAVMPMQDVAMGCRRDSSDVQLRHSASLSGLRTTHRERTVPCEMSKAITVEMTPASTPTSPGCPLTLRSTRVS
jgi:hypothetical protein